MDYKQDKIKVNVAKNFSITNYDYYKNKLNQLSKKNVTIILDLEQIEYIDCKGLDIIIDLYHKLNKHNSNLKLKNISSPYIKKFITLTNLNQIIEIL